MLNISKYYEDRDYIEDILPEGELSPEKIRSVINDHVEKLKAEGCIDVKIELNKSDDGYNSFYISYKRLRTKEEVAEEVKRYKDKQVESEMTTYLRCLRLIEERDVNRQLEKCIKKYGKMTKEEILSKYPIRVINYPVGEVFEDEIDVDKAVNEIFLKEE